MRKKLPSRRPCITSNLELNGIQYTVTAGYYDNQCQDIGEIFIDCSKTASFTDYVAKDSAVLLSLLFQHGVAPSEISSAMIMDNNGNPMSLAGAALHHVLEANESAERDKFLKNRERIIENAFSIAKESQALMVAAQ